MNNETEADRLLREYRDHLGNREDDTDWLAKVTDYLDRKTADADILMVGDYINGGANLYSPKPEFRMEIANAYHRLVTRLRDAEKGSDEGWRLASEKGADVLRLMRQRNEARQERDDLMTTSSANIMAAREALQGALRLLSNLFKQLETGNHIPPGAHFHRLIREYLQQPVESMTHNKVPVDDGPPNPPGTYPLNPANEQGPQGNGLNSMSPDLAEALRRPLVPINPAPSFNDGVDDAERRIAAWLKKQAADRATHGSPRATLAMAADNVARGLWRHEGAAFWRGEDDA